jgi:hypothetical protein
MHTPHLVVECAERIEHLLVGARQRSSQLMDPQAVRQILVLCRLFW